MTKLPNHLRLLQNGKVSRSVRSVLSVSLLAGAWLCFAQQPAPSAPAQQAAEVAPATPANADTAKPMSPKQKQLTDDTAKLQVLANELKAEMDKSNKDTLSLSVIKKAEAVEKLAHKVEDEMKASLVN
jgi:hypothetical protein